MCPPTTQEAPPSASSRLLPLPLRADGPSAQSAQTGVSLVAVLGLLVIATSAALINFNKVLMAGDRFPYAIVLVLIHTAFSAACSGVLLVAKPSLFPALTDPDRRVNLDASFLFKRALPVALFFAGQLVLSNSAYTYASVAFLQMMKESNVVLVYVFSIVASLEAFRWRSAWLLLAIVLMTLVTVKGEINFSWHGFAIQGLSCACESGKIIVQSVLLSGTGRKLDPLSYVLVVSPMCFFLLSSTVLCHVYVMPLSVITLPAWSELYKCRMLLFANAWIAFLLNVVIALFIKYSSAMSFVLVGIVKDAMIVVLSAVALHQPLSAQQWVGFPLQLLLVLVWSLMKAFPERFQDGVVPGIKALVAGAGPAPSPAKGGSDKA